MAKVPAGRVLAITAGIVRATARRSRTVSALGSGARAAWRSLSRSLRQLWHEVTGFLFLSFAALGMMAAVRQYRLDRAPGWEGRLAVALCFSAVFAWFGITSFWRARKAGSRN